MFEVPQVIGSSPDDNQIIKQGLRINGYIDHTL